MLRGTRAPYKTARHSKAEIKVVDLFCGVGGLSHGLILEGLNVVAGVDNDPFCKYAFEKNNFGAKFIRKDIARFTSTELQSLFNGAKVRVLVGCAPCQPYSSLNKKRLTEDDAKSRWYPLYKFMRLISKVKPEIVSMENVPDLSNEEKYPVFTEFLRILRKHKYSVSYKIIDSSRYGVPQKRKRLVLLASRLGPISMVPETHSDDQLITVRDAIGKLPRLRDGGVDANDPLHRASKLSSLNKRRIQATPKNGGNAKSWSKELVPACYKKKSGKTYMSSVYGRMRWDEPSPTVTTHCTSLGTGRFGHPTQNRAISLREAAILQSFPSTYLFAEPSKITTKHVARQIGNAVPVLLGRAIGASLKEHIAERTGLNLK